MSVNALMSKQAWIDKISADPTGVADTGSAVIRDYIREYAFNRQIIPMRPIGPESKGMQVSPEHDTFMKIEWHEPTSRAMVMNFRGGPSARIVKGPKTVMGFFSIASEKFEITTQELQQYPFGITKLIEDNIPLDIQEVEDREWLIHVEAAVQAMQKEGNGGTAKALNYSTIAAGTTIEHSIVKGERARTLGVNTSVAQKLERPDIVELKKLHTKTRGRASKILITDYDLTNVDGWTLEDVGLETGEITKTGWKSNIMAGLTIVRTLKQDILRPGNIYSFPEENFVGRAYQLGEMQFFAKRDGNRLMWWAWEDISVAILNVAHIKKLELYGGDANPATDANSILSDVIPVDEDMLGSFRSQAYKGVYEPRVVMY